MGFKDCCSGFAGITANVIVALNSMTFAAECRTRRQLRMALAVMLNTGVLTTKNSVAVVVFTHIYATMTMVQSLMSC